MTKPGSNTAVREAASGILAVVIIVLALAGMVTSALVLTEKHGWDGVGWFFAIVFIFVASIASIVASVLELSKGGGCCSRTALLWTAFGLRIALLLAHTIVAIAIAGEVSGKDDESSDKTAEALLYLLLGSALLSLLSAVFDGILGGALCRRASRPQLSPAAPAAPAGAVAIAVAAPVATGHSGADAAPVKGVPAVAEAHELAKGSEV